MDQGKHSGRADGLPQKFMSSRQIEKNAMRMYGLDYHEALEMSYDNLLDYANGLERHIRRLDKALAKLERQPPKV